MIFLYVQYYNMNCSILASAVGDAVEEDEVVGEIETDKVHLLANQVFDITQTFVSFQA